MAGPAMAPIERRGVAGEEPLHDRGERHRSDSYRDVKAVVHEAIGEEIGARFPGEIQKALSECRPVRIVGKNILPIHSESHSVIGRAVVMNSLCPFHTYHTIEPREKLHERN